MAKRLLTRIAAHSLAQIDGVLDCDSGSVDSIGLKGGMFKTGAQTLVNQGMSLLQHIVLLTGRMDGENVRGPEKARRLDEWIALELPGAAPFVWAYGDSSGDKELWARADRSVRFGRRAHKGTG